jgi:hypothetical protein
MKPDWDKLMKEFEGHKSTLVGDVDCTTEGKPLCDGNGVKGFPTIKHGDPSALEDYSGGRDFDSLQKFAQGLKALCSPSNMDLCDDEGKAKIEKVQAMSDEEIATAITDGESKMEEAETTFKTELEKLQATYQALQTAKEDAVAAVKDSGLGLLKSVQAAKKQAAAAPAVEKEEL